MSDAASPTSEADLCEIVRDAAARHAPIEIVGGGTRLGCGGPVQAAQRVTVAGIRRISLYEPGALTLVADAGAPLAEVESALAAEGQRLTFEPADLRAFYGVDGAPTVGAAAATNLSGPRRVQSGACRDSMIGVRFVNGSGEAVKNGGRVMKNVTGYDLVKLLCGSHGSLGVLTEVGFKVGPSPETSATLTLHGLDDDQAAAAMSDALGSPFEVTGAAHLPAHAALTPGDAAATLLRLEGFEGSVAQRTTALTERLARFGQITTTSDPAASAATWKAVRDLHPFAKRTGAVWRLSLKPTDGPLAARAIAAAMDCAYFFDWGGGLLWVLTPESDDAGVETVRGAVATLGGHATLMRAPTAVRAAVPVFQPEAPALAAIGANIKAAFDPAGILNPGRI